MLYTPQGLKIRLKASQAFMMMSFLHPKIEPITILKTTEAYELATSFALSVTALFAVIYQWPWYVIALSMVAAGFFIFLCTTYGIIFAFTLLRPLLMIYRLPGISYICFAGIAVASLFRLGWQGFVTIVATRLVYVIISNFLGYRHMVRTKRLTGWAFSESETYFMIACMSYASSVGLPTYYLGEIDFTSPEVEEKADKLLLDFSISHPDLFLMLNED
jgi:hypothetical protein